jgi:hypothetical protein
MILRGAVLDVQHERLLDDIALAAENGIGMVRIDVPWAQAQPRAAAFDGDVFERVHTACTTASALGVAPWLRLLQPVVPPWFDDEGGLTDDRNAAKWWPRWVEAVADRLGEVVAGWVPFEAPYAMCVRLAPDDLRQQGDVLHTLLVAWRDAWRLLHGVHPLATSLDVATERPPDDSPTARGEAKRRDQMRWDTWLRSLTDGIARVPGRADREMSDLAGSLDVLGVALRREVEGSIVRVADYGLDLPIAVTFRPTADTDGGRAAEIATMWRQVREVSGGIPVHSVSITPFVDLRGAPGIVSSDRELKDSGHTFTTD